MKLNQNSVSAKLYKWAYDTHLLPESLCPYFWKLVFAWVLAIILSPFWLATTLFSKVTKEFEDATMWFSIAVGLFIYAMLFFIIGFGFFISSYWITYYTGTLGHGLFIAGATVTVVSIIGLFTWGIIILKDKLNEKHHRYVWDDNTNDYILNPNYKEPKANIIVEFIKAKYNKYCPKIDWTNE